MRASVIRVVAAGVLLFSANAFAGAESDIKYRQSVMKATGGHMMALGAILKGDVPHRGDLVIHANALAASGEMLAHLFPAGSGTGRTKAKAEIWTDMATFLTLAANLEVESKKLVAVSKAPTFDATAFTTQLRATGGACKACHDKFRVDD